MSRIKDRLRPPLPYWARLLRVAAARRLKRNAEHACVINDAFGSRGVIELRWLPQRQMYSLWLCLEKMVYADIKPHLLDFAAGADALLADVEAAKNAQVG